MNEENNKTGNRKRRGQYSLEDKLKLLDEADQPGESLEIVARR